MKKATRRIYSNCYFLSFYMFLRGSIRSLALLESHSVLWPCHFVGLNRNGHAVHFQYTRKEDVLAPFWFEGNVIGVRKSKIPRLLSLSRRKVIYVIENRPLIFLILLSIWLTLFVPWVLCTAAYMPLWTLTWGVKAVRRYR